jgi:deoxyribonuclease V
MQIPRPPHAWSVTPREAVAIQRRLARRVRRDKPKRPLARVAGVDASFSRDERYCLAGVVLWDTETSRVVESHTARRRLVFPYVPGLLSFREAPAILAALRKLRHKPDVILCDGQGLAHPRRFGIAAHVGVLTRLPSIGCAKSVLVGDHEEPGSKRGARRPLVHDGETVGVVLRTRDGVKPVYVSIGHRIDLDTAVETVLRSGAGFRLPEPTRLADRLVARARRDTPEG